MAESSGSCSDSWAGRGPGWCGCGPTTTWAQDGVPAPLRRGWGGAKDTQGVSFLAHGAQSAANMRSDHRVSSFPSSC